jgi:hypothetical protein
MALVVPSFRDEGHTIRCVIQHTVRQRGLGYLCSVPPLSTQRPGPAGALFLWLLSRAVISDAASPNIAKMSGIAMPIGGIEPFVPTSVTGLTLAGLPSV